VFLGIHRWKAPSCADAAAQGAEQFFRDAVAFQNPARRGVRIWGLALALTLMAVVQVVINFMHEDGDGKLNAPPSSQDDGGVCGRVNA